MKIKNKGFTVIELMITVAIVGILGVVGVPAYQDYTVRAQVAEGLSLASGAKIQVAESYAVHGNFDNVELQTLNSDLISALQVDNQTGVITATFGNDAHNKIQGKFFALTPFTQTNSSDNLNWGCSSDLDKKFLPSSCTASSTPTAPANGLPPDNIFNLPSGSELSAGISYACAQFCHRMDVNLYDPNGVLYGDGVVVFYQLPGGEIETSIELYNTATNEKLSEITQKFSSLDEALDYVDDHTEIFTKNLVDYNEKVANGANPCYGEVTNHRNDIYETFNMPYEQYQCEY